MYVCMLVGTYIHTYMYGLFCIYRLVVLDPVLCDALLQKGEAPLEQMAWAQLMERLVFSLIITSLCFIVPTFYIIIMMMYIYICDKK